MQRERGHALRSRPCRSARLPSRDVAEVNLHFNTVNGRISVGTALEPSSFALTAGAILIVIGYRWRKQKAAKSEDFKAKRVRRNLD